VGGVGWVGWGGVEWGGGKRGGEVVGAEWRHDCFANEASVRVIGGRLGTWCVGDEEGWRGRMGGERGECPVRG
jgi:hypothetical protein